MKAAQINDYGDPSVVQIKDIDKPKINEDQVLVEVHASSINPFDAKLRAGYMKEMITLQFPVTLGGDIAGVIVGTGSNVKDFAVGDKVYGQANAVAGNSGAFAEYAATSAQQIAKMPDSLDFEQAASVVLVGVSALQAVTEHIDLQAGQRIFIHGGAGGIGSIAIQIAKAIGAHVTTTATGEGIEYVKQLGADEVVDYESQDYSEKLKDYDAVFDCVGEKDFTKILAVLKAGGTAVSMIGTADEELAEKSNVKAINQNSQVSVDRLDKLTELIETGVVKPKIDEVYPLEKISEAFSALETGHVRGKVVISIR